MIYYLTALILASAMTCRFKKYNTEFEYEILNIPMLPFYSRDIKDRHIGYIGYGLFWL